MERLKIVSIAFHTAGKIFDFDAQDFDLVPGDKVIVETERGRALGTVVSKPREITQEQAPPKLKAILRIAADSDLQMAENNSQREREAQKFCQKRVHERKMEMKLVRTEYLFDGSKIIFYFTADGRVDFRELVRDLAQHFRTRIEMRQIGVRDEAKLVGGIGICGRELCCCSYLREFAPVSVKMAKAQGLALNPTKISGQCGRLLCCLAYEYETYSEMKKSLPKCGKKMQLGTGTAEVVSLDILAQKVTLACQNGERCQMHIDELRKELDSPVAVTPTSPAAQTGQSRQQHSEQPTSPAKKSARSSRRTGNKNHKQQEQQPQQEQPKSKEESSTQKPPRKRRRPRRRSNRPKPPEKQT